jgi:hypothetical protein
MSQNENRRTEKLSLKREMWRNEPENSNLNVQQLPPLQGN